MCATCGIIHGMNAIFSTLMTHLDGCRLRDLEEVAQISGVPFHTIAKIKRRQAHELSRPNSLSLGGDISFSTSPEAEIKALEDKALLAINQYVAYVNGSGISVSRIRSRCR